MHQVALFFNQEGENHEANDSHQFAGLNNLVYALALVGDMDNNTHPQISSEVVPCSLF